jgi:beta-phosphoglucomutase-like phosphatase (HAD superfamily)
MVPFDLPDAIVFDLDGTIVDTETVEYESIKVVWAHHKATYTVAHFEHVIGTAEAADWIEELVEHLGRDIDVTHAHALRHETKARLLRELRARPGIGALIEQATLAGVPLAVASNSPLAWVEARLHHLDQPCRPSSPSTAHRTQSLIRRRTSRRAQHSVRGRRIRWRLRTA